MTTPTLLRIIIQVAVLCAGLTLVAMAADPALTIYNQDFAVVRETLPLDLEAGSNAVRFSGATAHLEPDSVILRDPTGKHALVILEQNYRADPISQELLLNLYEGKTIDFVVHAQDGSTRVIAGKIVRSGYVPHYQAMGRFGTQYQYSQMAAAGGGNGQPIIEVNGKLQFSLPGEPHLSGAGRRYDSQAGARLDHPLQRGGEVRCRVELCDRRHDLERRLQRGGAGDGRHARPGRLGDAG